MVEEKKGTPATQAKNRYNAKAYDQIPLRVPKGKKQVIKDYVELKNGKGASINEFINKAIDEKMEKDR